MDLQPHIEKFAARMAEVATELGVFSDLPPEGRMESALEKIWRLREIVQGSWLFGAEVPIYLQNKIA